MFSDYRKNKKMIEGAYYRIKSYYHYNKNYIFMKEKIADFEDDRERMDATFSLLSQILHSPEIHKGKIIKWLNQIDYYVIPKSFKPKEQNGIFVSEPNLNDEIVDEVNFFINMPIELYILDSLWTVLIGKLAYDNEAIGQECFGNCIDYFSNYYEEKGDLYKNIKFEKRRLFKYYFDQYLSWKNKAIERAKKDYKSKNLALITLDVQAFYYSVQWDFGMLEDLLKKDDRLTSFSILTDIEEKIYFRYTRLLSRVRELEYSGHTVLPIGLFSSMIIANLYLSRYDREISSKENVLYYGRYVDDIIVVLDTKENVVRGNEDEFDRLLILDNGMLSIEGDKYTLHGQETLKIQRKKVKIIFLEKKKAGPLIKILANTEIKPSEMNVVPETELNLEDFEEAVYAVKSFTQETKIRDISKQIVDRNKLGKHMAQIVLAYQGKRGEMTDDEKKKLDNERNNIIRFFRGSNAINYHANWINAFYFLLLTSSESEWKRFEGNITEAIERIQIYDIEHVGDNARNEVKNKLREDLNKILQISMGSALALNPRFLKTIDDDVKQIALKLRHSNLFNHKLVSVPLINYLDDLPDELDLTQDDSRQIWLDEDFISGEKWRLSPRFISLDELFYSAFLQDIQKSGNAFSREGKLYESKTISRIENFFYKVNHIKKIEDGIELKITDTENKYRITRFKLHDGEKKPEIKIAIANIRLTLDECSVGLPRANTPVPLKKSDLMKWFKEAHENKVDYFLLPEFYLPYSWLKDVTRFVKKSGITVITGMKYHIHSGQAHNNVILVAPIYSGLFQQYRSSLVIYREKNDYAPLEKELLALHGLNCCDAQIPVYQIVYQDGISFGIFLCYEFTDICARALYKNEVDMLFTPEFNKDTGYFSNIIESLTRDLHAFIIQSNTSIYGDSRITGPYDSNNRDIVKIKGGDSDSIIIGTIDIEALHRSEKEEAQNMKDRINNYMSMSDLEAEEKLMEEKNKQINRRICTTSARFVPRKK